MAGGRNAAVSADGSGGSLRVIFVVQVGANLKKGVYLMDTAKGVESRCRIAPTTPCPSAPLLVDRVMSGGGGGMLLIFKHQGGGRSGGRAA